MNLQDLIEALTECKRKGYLSVESAVEAIGKAVLDNSSAQVRPVEEQPKNGDRKTALLYRSKRQKKGRMSRLEVRERIPKAVELYRAGLTLRIALKRAGLKSNSGSIQRKVRDLIGDDWRGKNIGRKRLYWRHRKPRKPSELKQKERVAKPTPQPDKRTQRMLFIHSRAKSLIKTYGYDYRKAIIMASIEWNKGQEKKSQPVPDTKPINLLKDSAEQERFLQALKYVIAIPEYSIGRLEAINILHRELGDIEWQHLCVKLVTQAGQIEKSMGVTGRFFIDNGVIKYRP